MSLADTVQQIYAAFGRGDVPAILEHLAEDVEWETADNSAGLPWLEPRRGRTEVPAFFATLGALEFHKFEPSTLLESGDTVVALIDLDVEVKATGRRVVEEEVHIWRFGDDGRVRRFDHKVDTYRHWAALHDEEG